VVLVAVQAGTELEVLLGAGEDLLVGMDVFAGVEVFASGGPGVDTLDNQGIDAGGEVELIGFEN
jgi:hypothetical protein